MSGRPNYKRKPDGNQAVVFEQLRALPGVSVQNLHGVGDGCPDFIVGFKRVNYLVELKDGSKPPSARKLTDAELEWHRNWKGQVHVCSSFEDVFKLITGQHPQHQY